MIRSIRIIGALLLAVAGTPGAWAAPPDQPAANVAIPKKDPKPAPRLVNPESVAALLMRATPEQRERALQKFPPDRQAQLRKQLAWFDSLPKAQQELQLQRLDRFAGLPPDKKVTVRLQMQHLNRLQQPRIRAIRLALTMLQSLPPAQREVRMNSPAFRQRFSAEELQIVTDLADAWLLPPM